MKHLQLSPQKGVNGAGKWVDEQLAGLSIREVKDIPHSRSIRVSPFLHASTDIKTRQK